MEPRLKCAVVIIISIIIINTA